jgi:hypothetical protein
MIEVSGYALAALAFSAVLSVAFVLYQEYRWMQVQARFRYLRDRLRRVAEGELEIYQDSDDGLLHFREVDERTPIGFHNK